ncbi:hypothetical protein T02_9084 [Trichinella nativa]|uniref:Uncharacterized protein n=1 Tax=Trichinella nativa TaxID=6335 RepID=A0A0V1KTX5_9BILA|nr:hypothetical protein T02_9084 [Trichinella nativa]
MYGSHFWTRVVSSNDLPIISADSSHVFSGQLYRVASRREQLVSYIGLLPHKTTMGSYIGLLPDKNNFGFYLQLESATP